jgi:hypothetical protein
LYDLVQMECLSGTERVVRVTSGHDVGYLHFRQGRIVHALTPDLVGERAALEILRWQDGSFEPCQLRVALHDTVHTGFQDLLLRAACAADEEHRDNLVEFPNMGRTTTLESALLEELGRESSADELRLERAGNGVRAVHVASDGQIVRTLGADEDFAGMACFAAQIANALGESLGLSSMQALEVRFDASECAIWLTSEGLLAVEAPNGVNVKDVRRDWERG